MYNTRLRSGRRRGQNGYVNLEHLEVNLVEFNSLDEVRKIKFEKRGSYFIVVETELPEKTKLEDILVSAGGVETVDLAGGIPELNSLFDTFTSWPVTLDLRNPSHHNLVDLSTTSSTSTTRNSNSGPCAAPVFLPQIPNPIIPAFSSVITVDGSNEVDLTMDDSDDDSEVAEASKQNSEEDTFVPGRTSSNSRTMTPLLPSSSTFFPWKKGQIVGTRFGVGSVYEDAVPGKPLIVLLHWDTPSSSDEKSRRPTAYLNMESEPIRDCANEKIFTYGSYSLNRVEFARFQPGMYLNDTIVDLFLSRLVEVVLPESFRNRVYVMTSHFYTKLEENKFDSVKTWTKSVDIFDKDFVLIPVNDRNHWSLAIICYLKRLLPDQTKSNAAIGDNAASVPDGQVAAGSEPSPTSVCIEGHNKNQKANDLDVETSQKGNEKRVLQPAPDANAGGEEQLQPSLESMKNPPIIESQSVSPAALPQESVASTSLTTSLGLLPYSDGSVTEMMLLVQQQERQQPTTEGEEQADAMLQTARPKRQVKKVKLLAEEIALETQLRQVKKWERAQTMLRKQQQEQTEHVEEEDADTSAAATPSSSSKRPRRSSSSASASKTPSRSTKTQLKKAQQQEESVVDDSPLIPLILKLDSTKTHETRDVAKNIRIWIQQEWERKKRQSPEDIPLVADAKTLPICPPPVPLQTNSCDCGVYLLHFAERFLFDRAEGKPFECTMNQYKKKFSKQFGSDWFPQSTIREKRMEMASFVKQHGIDNGNRGGVSQSSSNRKNQPTSSTTTKSAAVVDSTVQTILE